MALPAESNPQEEIIAATERLLAEEGPQKATVRAITQAAGVNVGAVNYHFGSRDGLMIAICARHMGDSNQQMIDRLQRLAVTGGRESVKRIFEPIVQTAFSVWLRDDVLRGLRNFMFVDRQLVHKLDVSEMSQVYECMQDALREACPSLSAPEVRRRFRFAMGTIMQEVRSHDDRRTIDAGEAVVEDLLEFVAGGFAHGQV
ncbi:MAG: TetR family transcriptional regulator [Pseudomonadales bacterium]|nr:TetR/AcrR family transcriptional regulator [Pseudomonadales bacterium]NIX09071.1 TetR family transcriptional regulator [Pseudomonadales bacterium]